MNNISTDTNKYITLGISGDYCPSFWETSTNDNIKKTKKTIISLNKQVDYSITNFECSIVDDEQHTQKKLSVKRSICNKIEEHGFDLFCLANNHILDNGNYGLSFTTNFLKKRGLKTVGAGNNLEEALSPEHVQINGKNLYIINATDATHYAANKSTPGVFPLKNKYLFQAIKKIKKYADVIIVIIHSDIEFVKYPAPWKVKLSRQLITAGANIVIHHHPHVLQGIEKYKQGLIAYSLGNFVFPVNGNNYMKDRDNHPEKSIYLKVKLDFNPKVNIDYEIIPTQIGKNNITTISTKEEAQKTFKHLLEISDAIKNNTLLTNYYSNICNTQMKKFIKGTYYALSNHGIIACFNYIKIHLTTKMHTNWIRGFFTLGHY